MTEMHADYDSSANAVSISLGISDSAESADQVHPRAIVALHNGHPVELQLLYPELGIDEPLDEVTHRYRLDAEALTAAVRAALAAPDREVTVDVSARTAA
jgi:hypothetical protein